MSIFYTPNAVIITDDSNSAREPLMLPANASLAEVESAANQYLGAPTPDPDWLGFANWLYQFQPIATAMEVARASSDPQGEPATTGLPAAMQEARLNQNYPAWAATWGQFLLASQMPPEALAEIVGRAIACHLPVEFIAALQPITP